MCLMLKQASVSYFVMKVKDNSRQAKAVSTRVAVWNV